MAVSDRGGNGNRLHAYIEEETQKTLNSYREQPNLVAEHSNLEQDTAHGGYATRQLFELVQNAADAMSTSASGGKIEIRLTSKHLLCADNGEPIDKSGVRALMFSHLSPKRGTAEIGRFGLGFKSVLGVTDAPEFYSCSGSFCFDRDLAQDAIQSVAPDFERYPVLRLAFPIDDRIVKRDRQLRKLHRWASNIVRLPLNKGSFDNLKKQMENFPPEFLLFVEHVKRLTLKIPEIEFERSIRVIRQDQKFKIIDGRVKRLWAVFKTQHCLSKDAKSDRRTSDDNDKIPIHWAAPLDRLDRPWAFLGLLPDNNVKLDSRTLECTVEDK